MKIDMKKYLLFLSIIINYSFCYGDSPPSWEPKIISENEEYFCWIDFNDNDTFNCEWNRKWILKIYNKDSILFWQKEYQPSICSNGLLSNDGKKMVYVEEWYYPDDIAVEIISKDKRDIYIKTSDFNISEKSLIETVSHQIWLDWYSLENDKLLIFTLDKKTWIIDIETGVMEMSEKDFWHFLGGYDFEILFLICFSACVIGAMSVIKTLGM
jgi:hypothetical protein